MATGPNLMEPVQDTGTTVSLTDIVIENIALVCHEANRAFCKIIGDDSQKPWEETDQPTKNSAIEGVKFRMQNPSAPPSAQHEAWMKHKLEDGWAHGDHKNSDLKTHPCLVPYSSLPAAQKSKDLLFQAVVDSVLFYTDYRYTRPLTFGEQAVGLSPYESDATYAGKRFMAGAIDLMNNLRTNSPNSAACRQASVAITDIETAELRLTKALQLF